LEDPRVADFKPTRGRVSICNLKLSKLKSRGSSAESLS
jgi:hypothetical protein